MIGPTEEQPSPTRQPRRVALPPSPGPGEYDYVVHLVLLGDGEVGKTSLLQRYAYDHVQDRVGATLMADVYCSTIHLGPHSIRVVLTDTAGQERFKSLSPQQVRGKHGMVLLFDVSRRETFDNVNSWYAQAQQHYREGHEPLVMLIGNKIDLERVVTEEEARAYADAHNYWYYEMSALRSPVDRDIRVPMNHFAAACFTHRVARAMGKSAFATPTQKSTKSEMLAMAAGASKVINKSEERRQNLSLLGAANYGSAEARSSLSVQRKKKGEPDEDDPEGDDVPDYDYYNNAPCGC